MIFLFLIFVSTIVNGSGRFGRVDGTKFDIQKGPCRFLYNEPCYSNKRINFYLYTNPSNGHPRQLNLKYDEPPEGYDSRKSLKVLIHGFSSWSYLDIILAEYLKGNVYNVLLVDWQSLSNRPCYLSAAANTWQVGKCTGLAIQKIFPTGDVHIVGFSLGAHVAAYASNFLNEQYGRKINRITGLDPALPLFTTPIDELKLDAGDAEFVDVIHTSMGIFGKLEPCGTQDFYVGNSPFQPGCTNHTNPIICSHWRSAQIFAESIHTNVGFWSKPCPNVWSYLKGLCSFDYSPNRTLMGEYADKRSFLSYCDNKSSIN